MLITPADKWFSRCVRERSGWRCESCGKQYAEGDTGLHCSHFITRGNWAVRFEPLNAFAHCFGCHMKFEGNPDLFTAWVEQRFSERGIRYEILRELANDLMRGKEHRRTKGIGQIAKHYQNEFETMQMLRSQGVTGRIEFVGWL